MLLLAYLSIFLARKQKCQRNALAWFFVCVCLFVLRFLCWVFLGVFFIFLAWYLLLLLLGFL